LYGILDLTVVLTPSGPDLFSPVAQITTILRHNSLGYTLPATLLKPDIALSPRSDAAFGVCKVGGDVVDAG
jgi:hypothetical protein